MFGDVLCYGCKHGFFVDAVDEDGDDIIACDLNPTCENREPMASQSWHPCKYFERE